MIVAFFRALFEILAEIVRGEVNKKETATDADPVPESLRARFRRKLDDQLRNR